MAQPPLSLGVAGLGTVGAGLLRLLHDNADIHHGTGRAADRGGRGVGPRPGARPRRPARRSALA